MLTANQNFFCAYSCCNLKLYRITSLIIFTTLSLLLNISKTNRFRSLQRHLFNVYNLIFDSPFKSNFKYKFMFKYVLLFDIKVSVAE